MSYYFKFFVFFIIGISVVNGIRQNKAADNEVDSRRKRCPSPSGCDDGKPEVMPIPGGEDLDPPMPEPGEEKPYPEMPGPGGEKPYPEMPEPGGEKPYPMPGPEPEVMPTPGGEEPIIEEPYPMPGPERPSIQPPGGHKPIPGGNSGVRCQCDCNGLPL